MANRKGFIPVILIAVLALVIAVGGVGIGLAWRTNRLDKWLPPNIKEMFGRGEKSEEEPGEEPPKASELESLDETWNLYTNYQLGFSIKVPKKAMVSYGGSGASQCEYGEELVPVKVFEDVGNNRVYIAWEHYYSYPACDKVVNSLEVLSELGPCAWEIAMVKIANDSELNALIEKRYGSGCIGEKKPAGQEGVYDVEIQDATGKGWHAGGCPVNYVTVVKYLPAGEKAVFWNIGNVGPILHSYSYATGTVTGVEYDGDMIDSFRFIE